MEKSNVLFIEGDFHIGKSSVLRESCMKFNKSYPYDLTCCVRNDVDHEKCSNIEKIGGFYIQRLMDGSKCVAFSLKEPKDGYVLERPIGKNEDENSIFLDSRKGEIEARDSVFEERGVDILDRSVNEDSSLVILDEIGGIELECENFMEKLSYVLSSGIPCIGILKSNRNSIQLEQNVKIAGTYSRKYLKLRGDIIHKFQGRIIEASKDNVDYVNKEVNDFIERVMKNNL